MTTRWVRLSFEKGINEYPEASDLEAGHATAISNWVPESSGALRVKRGWINASTTGLTGTRTCRGMGYYVYSGTKYIIVAQASDATTYKIIRTAADFSGSWTTVETLTVASSATPVSFSNGAGVIAYTNTGFTGSDIRKITNTTAAAAAADNIAGRFVHYHNNRFFGGGDVANPTYLRWSELGDSATWTVGTNYQPLGQDDGEPLESACTWDRGLFVGKENSIWYVSGFGPDTFAFRPLDGGGVAPGKTLVPTPAGIFAIGRERIYNFTGGGFEVASRPIETSYGMTGDYMTGCYLDGRLYVCDAGSGTIWSLDLQTNAWTSEAFVTAADGPGSVFSLKQYLIAGTKVGGSDASTASVLQYREEPGGTRLRNENYPETFTANTPEFSGSTDEPAGPSTIRNVAMMIRQRDGSSSDPDLTVKIYTDGTLQYTRTVDLETAGVWRAQVSGGSTGYTHQIRFSHPITATGLVDIEEVWVELDTEQPR